MTFRPVDAQLDLPKQEEEILAYWKKIDAFHTSLEKTKDCPRFTFYDGPPFATGLPHYGHFLAGTIKDIVTRYATQTGHYVERNAGWDTHGLPIEFEIEKELGLKTKEDVLKYGIGNYNEACRGIVMRYSTQWRETVERLGRWIDFDKDYKTMDITFMESVWWVFKSLFEKDGMVYRGVKVMPYSTGCTTPLSNFEANLNYKDQTKDPECVVTFPLLEDPETAFVAWTTTPWTLPSNLALCVNPKFEYITVLDKPSGMKYIFAKERLKFMYTKKQKDQFQILGDPVLGETLVGKKYVPLFNYFKDEFEGRSFRVVSDPYVTNDSGTGVVHQAPGFGEDDYRVCIAHGIVDKEGHIPCPIDESGRFTKRIVEYCGRYIKDVDPLIIAELKKRKRLVKSGSIIHSYPFCWRSDTPLIYRTIPSWFVAVEKIKDKLVENNKKSYWVPENVQHGRFHNWLENAKDWAISRSRYWGTPIPIWTNDDYTEMVCIGSVEELEKLSGKKVTDLHRHNIDDIEIPAPSGNGTLKRIPEVFDCWFESGSMPYAEVHYPFAWKGREQEFLDRFPANFIAEGLDQTRGWFYTLLVLGTALFDQCPFQNLIVNGIVLAADGNKMSKRLKNYPKSEVILSKYGADALRLYLINSPVVKAQDLKFEESGVNELVLTLFRRWSNTYRLFVQCANGYEKKVGSLFTSESARKNVSSSLIDKWIISRTNSLIKFFRTEMAAFRLYTVIPKLVDFILELANIYCRVCKARLKGETGIEDQKSALQTLYTVLLDLCLLMAPFTPFITDAMYQNLKLIIPKEKQEDSVHYLRIPEVDEDKIDLNVERAVTRMWAIIEAVRVLREEARVSTRIPVRSVTVCHMDADFLEDVKLTAEFIKFEMNVKEVKVDDNVESFFSLVLSPKRELGSRLKRKFGRVKQAFQKLSQKDSVEFLKSGKITVEEEEFTIDDIDVSRNFTGDKKKYVSKEVQSSLVVLDKLLDDDLRAEGALREMVSSIMQLRKSARLKVEDETDVYLVLDEKLQALASNNLDNLHAALPKMKVHLSAPGDDVFVFAVTTSTISKSCGTYDAFTIQFSGASNLVFTSLMNQSQFWKDDCAKWKSVYSEEFKAKREAKDDARKKAKEIKSLTKRVKELEDKVKALEKQLQ